MSLKEGYRGGTYHSSPSQIIKDFLCVGEEVVFDDEAGRFADVVSVGVAVVWAGRDLFCVIFTPLGAVVMKEFTSSSSMLEL